MTNELLNTIPDLKAAGDLSAAQYKIMKLSAANTVTTASVVTDTLVGILVNKPSAAGHAAAVAGPTSIAPCIAGGAVSAGALVTTDAEGRGVAASPAAGTNNFVVGIALTAAANANELFSVLVLPQRIQG